MHNTTPNGTVSPTHGAGIALAVAATAVFLAGCGGSPTTPPAVTSGPPGSTPSMANPAAANGWMATPQATGQVPALPPGTLYVDIEQVPAAPVPTVALTRDCALYATTGAQPVLDHSGATTSAAGAFLGPDGAAYPKTGNTVAATAFCLRPATDRGQAPVVPGATSVFASGDISDLTTPGPYKVSLQLVHIQPGGHGAAHSHPGAETVLTVDGAITYHLGGPTPVTYNGATSPFTLTAGHAMTHKPNQPIQDFNSGNGVATTLAFIVWPANQPVRKDEPHAP